MSTGKIYQVFFGSIGCTLAMTLTVLGSAIGFALCGVRISAVAVENPNIVIRSLVPIVMISVISIYGLVVSIVIAPKGILLKMISVTTEEGTLDAIRGFKYFASGLTVGMTGIAAGYALGRVGDDGILAYSKQPRFFVGLILLLIFSEVLGIYGLIIALILAA